MEGRDNKGKFIKGHKISEKLKEINRKTQTGRKHSDITKKKHSIISKEWHKKPENRRKYLKSQKESAFKRRKWKISKEELSDLYWNQKLSIRQIAKKFDTSYGLIHSLFERENIPRRTSKEGIKLNPPKITDIGRKSISNSTKKRKKEDWQDPEYRKKMLKVLENARGNITEESLQKNRESHKKLWMDSKFVKKMFKALAIKPNKPEIVLINLIKQNNLNYFYNLGKVVIGGKVPDFIHNKDKKIVEMHGRAFHDPNSKRGKIVGIHYNKTEKGTIEHYNKNGYDCLVIWNDELNNQNKVLSKISSFS